MPGCAGRDDAPACSRSARIWRRGAKGAANRARLLLLPSPPRWQQGGKETRRDYRRRGARRSFGQDQSSRRAACPLTASCPTRTERTTHQVAIRGRPANGRGPARVVGLLSVGMLKAITIAALLVVAALAGCGTGSGSSRAEKAVHHVFQQTSDLGTLESVSCDESKTPEPPTEAKIALYDCQVTTSENGEVTWCLVDGPAGMAPFPLSCAAALSQS
jgi:hypothetical protein